MLRKLILSLFVVSAITGAAGDASANPISKNNPYRSFNISGVNYGSMKWEGAHGRRHGVHQGRHQVRLFRGR
jgi:hypothetical protein